MGRCILCEQNNSEAVYIKSSPNILKCENCGLVYLARHPSGVDRQIRKNYTEYYLDTLSSDRSTFKKRLEIIGNFKMAGRLLDVGCSIGTFLDIARSRGWEAYGVDIDKEAIDYCINTLRLNVKAGELGGCVFPLDYFDIVTMNDVVEHLKDPFPVFLEIKRILKKDGLLFISTPNINSIVAKIMGIRWVHLKPQEHVYYFTPHTIEKILKKTGFNVVACRSIGRVRNMLTVISTLKSYNESLYLMAKRSIPHNIARNLMLYINLSDEFYVLAKKA